MDFLQVSFLLLNFYEIFWIGALGCIIDSIIVIACSCISMISLLVLSVDKFVAIVFNVPSSPYFKYRFIRPLNAIGAIASSIVIWISMFFFVLMPFINQSQGTAYSLQSSHLTCCWSWWRGEAIILIFNVIGTLVIIVGGFLMTFAYYIIIKTVIISQQETKKHLGAKASRTEVTTSNAEPHYSKEKRSPQPNLPVIVPHKVSIEEKWLILNGLVISVW